MGVGFGRRLFLVSFLKRARVSREAAMFEGKTADCLALANTAILIRLIDQIVEAGAITKPYAHTLLREAVNDLKACPDANRTGEVIKIIQEELMPRLLIEAA